MSVQTGLPASISARVLLVFGTLVCLCVSSNVAVQFFPLAAVANCITKNAESYISTLSRNAPESETDSFRVPMMVQSQKRVDQESPHDDSLIVWSNNESTPSVDTRFAIETWCPIYVPTSASIMPSAGRAPPSWI